MTDKTVIVKAEGHDVPWEFHPSDIREERATKEKGFPHPGDTIWLPGEVGIPMQYGKSPLEVRNGLLDTEVLQGVVDRLKVFQKPGSPMANRETALAITKIEEAIHWLQHRQLDRQARAVRFTDEA